MKNIFIRAVWTKVSKFQSLFQFLMSYRMTKRELQHMIYMTEAKTKFHIKGETWGKEKKEKKRGA